MSKAYSIKVSGVVQGVGFRPFVYRLAKTHGLTGWVLNAVEGVLIHAEGDAASLETFAQEIKLHAPQAAVVSDLRVENARLEQGEEFVIRQSSAGHNPTARISPDLPVCDECLNELRNPLDGRHRYPYINCTNCGPRYSVITGLPYDRPNTTMAKWRLDEFCATEYHDPANRRFHAQPVACATCGPHYYFREGDEIICWGAAAIQRCVEFLQTGKIVAVKGLGGYHLVCDATNADSVTALRARKYRKEKPFAVMIRNLTVARKVVNVAPELESLINSVARPIVLTSAIRELPGVAPDNDELGVMLPYTPIHHLLFDAGAPEILVMTSANRSSEPIAYRDEEAFEQLAGIAHAFLIGERPIARRIDDSVVRGGVYGPSILRRARGYAPGMAAQLPTEQAILALGADLKNSITLVVDGQAFVSQHIGDLDHYESLCAFKETVQDLLTMYEVDRRALTIVHDAHPQYSSTIFAQEFGDGELISVQHHQAHVASVLAEQAAWDQRVIGVAFDGTGYGEDGSIWGGEFFAGSLREGFSRIAHLRPSTLAGGDAAASFPVQAAAGFLSPIADARDFSLAPFYFPTRYRDALRLIHTNLRSFATTSMGRLFDTAAALLGFTREITFEGQAAMWLERLAKTANSTVDAYPFPFVDRELDFRPLLAEVVRERSRGRSCHEIARAFQLGVAVGLREALMELCRAHDTNTVVLSGGVFQNELLLRDLKPLLENDHLVVWTNHIVPTNDGGISLGQAAIAALQPSPVRSCEKTDSAQMAQIT